MAKQAEDFERPILTIDVVMFSLIDGQLQVLLVERPQEPYKGVRALVGGYIHTDEDRDTHAAAKRVALAKVGVAVAHLEQLAMFSGPKRDPRGWSATMAYIAMMKSHLLEPALLREFRPVDRLPKQLAFDHREIIRWAVRRLRDKASYSTLPLFLMPREFTLLELHGVYEQLMGQDMDISTFRRKIKEFDVVIPTGKMSDPRITHCRPAELYRQKASDTVWLMQETA